MIDKAINFTIFAVTLIIIPGFFRKDGKWDIRHGRYALCFFTAQSNILCAISALILCFSQGSVAWFLKYIGTAAVTVTMLTVFLFLAPSMGGLVPLLNGKELFLHLITPLLALFSFFVFEKRGLSFVQSLLGMLPVVLYGPLYLYKILYAPEEKRWKDFYGFNKGGKWPVAFAGMAIGTFLICMGMMALQNL